MEPVSGLHRGMTVYGRSGHRLGRIAELGPEAFRVERGMLFQREYVVPYGAVQQFATGSVVLLWSDPPQSKGAGLLAEPVKGASPEGSASALGPLGRARMDRIHDVIGAWTRPPAHQA